MHRIIAELVRNFQSMAATFQLSKAASLRHLNGDLRALLLVSTAKPIHLSPPLLLALTILKERVSRALALISDEHDQQPQAGEASEGGQDKRNEDDMDVAAGPSRSTCKVSLESSAKTSGRA